MLCSNQCYITLYCAPYLPSWAAPSEVWTCWSMLNVQLHHDLQQESEVFNEAIWTCWTSCTHWVWSTSFTNSNQHWRTLRWDCHTLCGGFDPWDHRLGSWSVGVVEIQTDFLLKSGTLSSTCAAPPRRWPEGQLSPRAGSMSPNESATSPWG